MRKRSAGISPLVLVADRVGGNAPPRPVVVAIYKDLRPSRPAASTTATCASRATRDRAADPAPRLYSHHHSPRWLAARVWPVAYELYCWRSVGVEFTRLYCHSGLFGARLLRLLFRLEDRWPRLLGTIGQYPMIVLAKRPSQGKPS